MCVASLDVGDGDRSNCLRAALGRGETSKRGRRLMDLLVGALVYHLVEAVRTLPVSDDCSESDDVMGEGVRGSSCDRGLPLRVSCGGCSRARGECAHGS